MICFLAGIDAGKLQLLALVDPRSKHGAFCSQISLIRERSVGVIETKRVILAKLNVNADDNS